MDNGTSNVNEQTQANVAEGGEVKAGEVNPVAEVIPETPDQPQVEPEVVPESNETVSTNIETETPAAENVIPEAPSAVQEPVATEEEVTPIVAEVPVEEEFTPMEKVLADWLANGKTEVSTNELVQAGFDVENNSEYTYVVGRFTLNRLLLVSPFKIQRTEKK